MTEKGQRQNIFKSDSMSALGLKAGFCLIVTPRDLIRGQNDQKETLIWCLKIKFLGTIIKQLQTFWFIIQQSNSRKAGWSHRNNS